MNIIPASTVEHFRLVQDIAYQAWPSTFATILSGEQIAYMLKVMYNVETLAEQSASQTQNFLLVQDQERSCGFISYALDHHQAFTSKIHKLYLLPSAKGKGVGKLLMERVENIAHSQQQKVMTLNVNKYNPSLGFYERMGYNIVKEEKLPIGPYWMDDYVMEKMLLTEQ